MKNAFLLSAIATVLSQPLAAASCKMVLAYYADWNKPAYSAAKIPFSKLTHICHAFVLPNSDGSLNVDSGFLEPALISGAHAAGVKVLVSIGGANGSAPFPNIAANTRQVFANTVRDLIQNNGYDGVDIDWEFPSNATDRSNFNLLMQTLRSTFNAAGHTEWLISGAFSSDQWQIPQYDLATLKNSVNFFNVMTYDYHGPWSSHMGHNAPLARGTGDPDNISDQASIAAYLSAGVPASQLVFGVPFYGYNFPVEDLNNGCPGGACGGATYVGYLTAASDVGNGWTRYWDAAASSPYLRANSSAQTITYDDPQSIQAKCDWALNTANLAGVFMWELSGDYTAPAQQPLLDAMRAPLACGPTPTPTFTPTPVIFPIPGRIQAEDYWQAADSTAGNAGGVYRTGDTDVEATTDTGGGYDVGYTDVGEWLDYKVQVGAAGTYDFTFRIASATTTAMNLSLQWDGAALGGSVALTSTGGWQTWADVKVTGLALSVGAHTLRVLVGTGGYNLNYIDVAQEPHATPTSSSTRSRTPTVTLTRSPTASSTPSPSATASRTPTLSRTPSPTLSSTVTPTLRLTATPSATITPSPAGTLTDTPSVTLSPDFSSTPSRTPSSTPSLSASATPSSTLTPSATLSPSATPTTSAQGSASPSTTVTITRTPTQTGTPHSSPSSTSTAAPSAVPTATPSVTPAASALPTAVAEGGLIIRCALPVPNPDPRQLSVQLEGRADEIELRLYSNAGTLMGIVRSGPREAGWCSLALPPEILTALRNGSYFYVVEARRGTVRSTPKRGTLLCLR